MKLEIKGDLARYRTTCDKIAELWVVKTVEWVVALDVGHTAQLQEMNELCPVQIHDSSLHINIEAIDRLDRRPRPWFEARKLFCLDGFTPST